MFRLVKQFKLANRKMLNQNVNQKVKFDLEFCLEKSEIREQTLKEANILVCIYEKIHVN